MPNFENVYAKNEIITDLPELCLMIWVERLFPNLFSSVKADLNGNEIPASLQIEPGWVFPLLLESAPDGSTYNVNILFFKAKSCTLEFKKRGGEWRLAAMRSPAVGA